MAVPDRVALLWGASFFAGSLAQLAARFTGIPVVVLLLAVGLLAGEAGLGWIHPSHLGRGLDPLVGLLVCLVLFDGGINLRLVGRSLQRSLLQLVVVRSLLGFACAALLAHLITGLAWPLALVFAAISLATGPTVVTPLVRQMRLSPFLAQLLEAEGLILEPVAAVLALLLLQLALGELNGWRQLGNQLLLHLVGGTLVGAAAGWLLALLLERLTPLAHPASLQEAAAAPAGSAAQASGTGIAAAAAAAPAGHSQQGPATARSQPARGEPIAAGSAEIAAACLPGTPAPTAAARATAVAADALPPPAAASGDTSLALQVTLGVLFLLFSGCEALLPESGLPAAVSAGVVVGLSIERTACQLHELIGQLALLAITVLFPLLAADVSWQELLLLGGGGLLCVLALTPARWLVLQVAGLGVPLDGRAKLLLSWVAPRGIVTAAVASLFALRLDAAGVPGAGELKGLVFLSILITVGLQGASAPWLARRLGLSQPPGEPLIAAAPVAAPAAPASWHDSPRGSANP
jgi:NhaP-type Na+/H+ or K+/H+ antiporter